MCRFPRASSAFPIAFLVLREGKSRSLLLLDCKMREGAHPPLKIGSVWWQQLSTSKLHCCKYPSALGLPPGWEVS